MLSTLLNHTHRDTLGSKSNLLVSYNTLCHYHSFYSTKHLVIDDYHTAERNGKVCNEDCSIGRYEVVQMEQVVISFLNGSNSVLTKQKKLKKLLT